MTALALVAVVILVLLNGFYVVSEYALVRSRRGRLEPLAAEGDRPARLVLQQPDAIQRSICACRGAPPPRGVGPAAARRDRPPNPRLPGRRHAVLDRHRRHRRARGRRAARGRA